MKQSESNSSSLNLLNQSIFIDGSVFAAAKQSGIAYAVVNIITALAQTPHYHKQKIVVFLPRGRVYVPDVIRQLPQVLFRTLPLNARWLRIMSRLPLTFPIDVFLGKGLYIFPNYYNFSLLRSYSVTFIHDIAFLLFPETIASRNRRFLTEHISTWARRSNHIFTLSTASKDEIIEHLGINEHKVSVARIPLFRDVFFPRLPSEQIKKKYNLPEQYIVYLGNLEPRKNVANLVKGFVASRAVNDHISLLLIGADGWNDGDIHEAVNEARAAGALICFPSQHVESEDLPIVLSNAKLLVQPSLHEGLGLPPLQAIACGIPAIVSDIPVMRETFGSAVDYIKTPEANSIRKAINDQVNKGFKAMDSNKAEKILQHFTVTTFLAGLEALR